MSSPLFQLLRPALPFAQKTIEEIMRT
jgi:hypothetical protein